MSLLYSKLKKKPASSFAPKAQARSLSAKTFCAFLFVVLLEENDLKSVVVVVVVVKRQFLLLLLSFFFFFFFLRFVCLLLPQKKKGKKTFKKETLNSHDYSLRTSLFYNTKNFLTHDYPPQQKFFNESTSERFFVVSGGHHGEEQQHIDTHTRAEREREGVFGILRSPKLLLLCSRRETTTLSEEEERFVRVPILDLCCAFVAVQWITT